LIKETGFPEDVRDMLVLPEYTKAALPSKSNFESVIDWLINKGLIKDAYSYEELIDSSFIG
jgi:NitT/TauT family transport system substrate-binding protein